MNIFNFDNRIDHNQGGDKHKQYLIFMARSLGDFDFGGKSLIK